MLRKQRRRNRARITAFMAQKPARSGDQRRASLVQERDVARVGAEQQMIYKPRFSRADPSSRSPRDTVLIKMSPAEGKTSAGVTVFKRKMSEMP